MPSLTAATNYPELIHFIHNYINQIQPKFTEANIFITTLTVTVVHNCSILLMQCYRGLHTVPTKSTFNIAHLSLSSAFQASISNIISLLTQPKFSIISLLT